MWNPFKKKSTQSGNDDDKRDDKKQNTAQVPGMPNPKNMNMMQRLAMKKLMSMSNEEREKLMKRMTSTEKGRKQGLEQIQKMRDSGMITQEQYIQARKKIGA